MYDASVKQNGPSLNDCLETGPYLIPELIDVLIRFRIYPIALLSDIKKTLLNVNIREEDRDFLRFLLVDDVSKDNPELVVKRFTRFIFGSTSSQFLIGLVIHKHMSQLELTDPAFVRIYLQELYVGDYVRGASTEEEAFKFYKKIKETLLRAGFELRKWVSSDPLLQIFKKKQKGNIIKT